MILAGGTLPGVMGSPFRKLVDVSHRSEPATTILDADPSALAGVSRRDADALRAAFGIDTVRELALSRPLAAAQALLHAAGEPGFDPGPPPAWAALFAGAPLAHYRAHPSGRFRLSFGPVFYRGRLDGTARVLLVGQDPAANELVAHRALVGDSGQRVQGLLAKLGITRSYVMVNTFLYGVFGQYDDELRQVASEPAVADFRNAMLDRLVEENPVEVVIAVGRAAREAVQRWDPPPGLLRESITHPGSPDDAAVTGNWNVALARLAAAIEPDPGARTDSSPYGAGFAPEDHQPIPRADLPFGVPDFIGVGSHAERDGNDVLRVTVESL